MSNLRNFLYVFLFVILPFVVKPQEGKKLLTIKETEDSLTLLMNQMYSNSPISIKEVANNRFIDILKATFVDEKVFNYPFDSLKHIGRIKSEDKKIRIFSWNIPQSGGYQKYYGFIILKKEKGGIQLIELTDDRKSITNPIKDILTPNNWMGTLYYSISDVSYNRKTYYLLLGLDFNNLFSSKKIIDILSFDKEMQPKFGSSIFHVGDAVLSRVVFEFSARANMMLRYLPETKTVVFDHLSPSRPDYENNYQFYGPDFTYDGFKFEKGSWVYVRDLDLRNSKRDPAKPKESPEKLPDPGFLYKSKGGLPMQIIK